MKTPAERLPIPAAYMDPAFMMCLHEAIAERELVVQFNRLTNSSLCTARSPIEQMVDDACGMTDENMRKFTEFVHFSIYTRLPDDAIHSMRAAYFKSLEA